MKFPVTASSGAGSLVGVRWFFSDLQFLSAISGGTGRDLESKYLWFRQHLPHLVTRVNLVSLELCYLLLEWWIAGVMCDHQGRTFMAQFDLVRQRFAPRCYKSFSRGLFQGFYVIAFGEEGGLNSFGTFFNVSRSEQSHRTLRNWLDGMFLST